MRHITLRLRLADERRAQALTRILADRAGQEAPFTRSQVLRIALSFLFKRVTRRGCKRGDD